jgi:hypothetical protein
VGILEAIEGYMKRHKMAQTRFGRMAANDPRLVPDIRRGRTLGPKMLARIEHILTEETR